MRDFLPKSGCSQHLLLSLKSMSNWQFSTGQYFVVAWRSSLITFHPSLARSGRIIVYLKSSKTDIARESQPLTIVRTLFSLYAVAAMQEYFLWVRPQHGSLFYFQSGRYVTRGVVYNLLKDSARVAGLPNQSRKRHSFCIGAASVAGAASFPDWLIKVSQPLVLGLLPAVYQNSSIYIRVCGSQDGYCSWTLPANLASVFSTCLFVFSLGLGGCIASHASVAVKSAQRLPPSLLAALPFNITCKPILLSDPARAVLHSARSAGEISEVLCPCHRRKSHRLT